MELLLRCGLQVKTLFGSPGRTTVRHQLRTLPRDVVFMTICLLLAKFPLWALEYIFGGTLDGGMTRCVRFLQK
jgi:hypothetical protein